MFWYANMKGEWSALFLFLAAFSFSFSSTACTDDGFRTSLTWRCLLVIILSQVVSSIDSYEISFAIIFELLCFVFLSLSLTPSSPLVSTRGVNSQATWFDEPVTSRSWGSCGCRLPPVINYLPRASPRGHQYFRVAVVVRRRPTKLCVARETTLRFAERFPQPPPSPCRIFRPPLLCPSLYPRSGWESERLPFSLNPHQAMFTLGI